MRPIMTSIHHLDTSALVKILLWPDVKEGGSQVLNEFRQTHTGFYTLDLCVGEALNVLKRKWLPRTNNQKILSGDGYLICIDRLRTLVKPSHSIHVIPTDLSDDSASLEAQKLVKKFRIDFVDACIVITARASRPFHSTQNLLITAEKEMVEAAKSVSMPVWRCNKDTSLPPTSEIMT